MKPRIIEPFSLKLLGSVYYGDPFHSHNEGSIKNEIGRLWERFEKICSTHINEIKKISVDKNVAWEAHIQTETYAINKEYTIFAGIEVDEPPKTPIAFFYKELPKTKYAIFKLKGNDFITGLNFIYNTWLLISKYKESYGYMLWRYEEKTKDLTDPNSFLEAYIPVEEKNNE